MADPKQVSDIAIPNQPPKSAFTLVDEINARLEAINADHIGPTPPENPRIASKWMDTAQTPWRLRIRVAGQWPILGTLDPENAAWVPWVNGEPAAKASGLSAVEQSIAGLGSMASLEAGTAGDQFRNNNQNDERFARPGVATNFSQNLAVDGHELGRIVGRVLFDGTLFRQANSLTNTLSVSKTALGRYEITHNFGSTFYIPIAIVHGPGSLNISIHSIGSDTFAVDIRNTVDNSYTDNAFLFVVHSCRLI